MLPVKSQALHVVQNPQGCLRILRRMEDCEILNHSSAMLGSGVSQKYRSSRAQADDWTPLQVLWQPRLDWNLASWIGCGLFCEPADCFEASDQPR